MSALIGPEDNWSLLAIITTAAWLGVRLEGTRVGRFLSGAVISILITFTLANLRVIPSVAPLYDFVWRYLVPLAIPLLLYNADLRRILVETGPPLLAFVIGVLGTILGTFVAASLFNLGPDGWKVAGVFCATYIGGSMNYAGTAEALGLRSGDLLTAGIAADQLMMIAYFLVLFTLPSIPWVRSKFARRIEEKEIESEQVASASLDLSGISVALAMSALACSVGYFAEGIIGIKGVAILILTGLVVVAATAAPRLMGRLRAAPTMGMLLMQIFFAAIGGTADIRTVLAVGPVLFLFAGTILAVHLTVILLFGLLFRLDLAEIVIASNANMGGPTTASAMAAARRWPALIVPAILCGVLGYATANFIGVAVAHMLR